MLRKTSSVVCFVMFIAMSTLCANTTAKEKGSETLKHLSYKIDLQTIRSGYDGLSCWVHARAGAIPGAGIDGKPAVVMTMHKLLLAGNDVYSKVSDMRTDDLGKTWSLPVVHKTLARRKKPGGIEYVGHDYTPKWHAASGKLLMTGKTAHYTNNAQSARGFGCNSICSVYDADEKTWSTWSNLQMPNKNVLLNNNAGCTQRVDLPNGTILLPIAFGVGVTVVRCSFDGEELRYLEHGSEHEIELGRGFAEPSLTFYKGKYYMTLRNDLAGYITTSDDGLHFDKPIKWTFDDGSDLGNYNTQQHWVTHSDGLSLVYTRRGANNDHVFRNRAPLFMAQVDPKRLCVIRETERILVPERGARLGNFGVVEVDQNQTWVVVTEWMQTKSPDWHDPRICEKYGSNNAIFVSKIIWDKPNKTALKY